MADIAHDPRVALLFWNSRNNTQLRVCGKASRESSELIVNDCWDRIPDYARKDYATLSAPGTRIEQATSGYAINLAKDNFVVLNVVVQKIELLRLDREGHLRLALAPSTNGEWIEKGLIP